MAKRKNISKKTRFEIFKRDGFSCQYCGAHPPSVILHVDHIHPVVDGGGNDPENLITSCEPCNLGKGARHLSDIPKSLSDKAKEIEEAEAQIRGYNEIAQARRARIEDDVWQVAEIIAPGSSQIGMKRDWIESIKRFNGSLGLHSVLDAAEIARGRYSYGGKNTFLYFCGICWNRIREAQNGAR
jgi:hypothetical protein